MRRLEFSIVKYINYADKSLRYSVKIILLMKIDSNIIITLLESFFCVFHY